MVEDVTGFQRPPVSLAERLPEFSKDAVAGCRRCYGTGTDPVYPGHGVVCAHTPVSRTSMAEQVIYDLMRHVITP